MSIRKQPEENHCLIKAHYAVNKISKPQVQHMEFLYIGNKEKKNGDVFIFLQPVTDGAPLT